MVFTLRLYGNLMTRILTQASAECLEFAGIYLKLGAYVQMGKKRQQMGRDFWQDIRVVLHGRNIFWEGTKMSTQRIPGMESTCETAQRLRERQAQRGSRCALVESTLLWKMLWKSNTGDQRLQVLRSKDKAC